MRRNFMFGLLVVAAATIGPLFTQPSSASDLWVDAPVPDFLDWKNIETAARLFVSAESPAGTLPFDVELGSAAHFKHQVFAHYFPPYPVSFDNMAAGVDTYAISYLAREGEGGKYSSQGGFLRTRPLPIGPWPTRYWIQIDDAIEILRADKMGLNGFIYDIVDVKGGRWAAGYALMLDAAAHVDPKFKLVAAPDCVILSEADRSDIEKVLEQVWSHPSSLHLPDGRLLVAPFAAERRSVQFWAGLIAEMNARGRPIALLPVFLDPNRYAAAFASISYGESSWGDRDTLLPDLRLRLIKAKVVSESGLWMMPVTPQDERPNSTIFWEARNTYLFRREWEEAIGNGSQLVQLITWNDFSESTNVEPATATQFVYYDIGAYYAYWFKSGRKPRITKDAIYFTHRRELFDPDRVPRESDKPMHRLGGTPLTNDIEMVAFLVSPATLEIELNGQHFRRQAPVGMETMRAPASPGRPIFRILRHDKPVIELSSDWSIVKQEDALDPIYVGGSSNRRFVADR